MRVSNLVVSILLGALQGTTAWAEVPTDNITDKLCRKDQHKTVTRLARDSFNELLKCHDSRIKGRIDAATDCNDLANAPSTLRVTREQEKVAKRVEATCNSDRKPPASEPVALGYGACNAPCDSVAIDNTYDGQTACILCLAEEHVETLATAIFGQPATVLERDPARCQKSVGTAARNYFAKRVSIQSRCQTLKDGGKIDIGTDCTADDDRGQMVRARTTLGRTIGRCSDSDFAALDGCSATVAGSQACVLAAVETAADALFDAIYPPIPAPATPTATATETAEVTATTEATVTPTLTPDPCTGVECPVETACLQASTCLSGNCSTRAPKANGTACTDGNSSGTCQSGTCTDPCASVVCPTETECLFASTCSGGNCSSQAAKPNGTSCLTDANASGTCAAGECSAGDSNSSNSSSVIRVFPTDSAYKGSNINGRNASSQICNQAGYSNSSCTGSAVALLSYNGDSIAGLGSLFPAGTSVVSSDDVVLANDWSDFTDGSWQNSAEAAFGNSSFWTGSTGNGSQGTNCDDWTNGSVTGALTGGNATSFASGFAQCTTSRNFLCACTGGDGNATPCEVNADCRCFSNGTCNGGSCSGTPLPNNTSCTTDGNGSGTCQSGVCQSCIDFDCTNASTANTCNSPPNSQFCEWKSQISKCVLKSGSNVCP